ncbi:hypothetical protein PG985_009560 [Apiospora marii]|uniref:DUF7702 domain-containing protein n=1 Tax=Apiospora marii TaxID=335849 RepID=A0ABR1RFJ4_9PEZI
MNAHTAAGIAQVVFYAPITVYAQYVGFRCWKYRSRMACYMIMAFTLIRLVGGALVIAVEQDLSTSNANLIRVTYILLNIGLVPLLASYDGLLSVVSRENFPKNNYLRGIHAICALLTVLATGLLIGAGTLTGKADQASLQSTLYKIGYFDFVAIFVVAIVLNAAYYTVQRDSINQSHIKILGCLLAASPFLALRTVYGIIGIFKATGPDMFTSMWSSLFGSATALALMGLLPEIANAGPSTE